jgi:hypothetical protein
MAPPVNRLISGNSECLCSCQVSTQFNDARHHCHRERGEILLLKLAAASAACVLAAIAVSVAGVAAPPAEFFTSLACCSPTVDVPCLAAVGVSVDPRPG